MGSKNTKYLVHLHTCGLFLLYVQGETISFYYSIFNTIFEMLSLVLCHSSYLNFLEKTSRGSWYCPSTLLCKCGGLSFESLGLARDLKQQGYGSGP
jgi:hypothetical protein